MSEDEKYRLPRHWVIALGAGVSVGLLSMLGGLLTFWAYGNTAQLVEAGVALTMLVWGWKTMTARWDGQGFRESLGSASVWGGVVLLEASAAGWQGGGSWTIWAWLAGTAAGTALSFSWWSHTAEKILDLRLKREKSITIKIQQERAEHQRQAAEARLKIAQEKLRQTLEKESEQVDERPALPAKVPYQRQGDATWDTPVNIGVDAFGQPVELDVTKHLLVSGQSGSGKSNFIKLLLLRLAERSDTELVMVDQKGGIEAHLVKEILDEIAEDERSTHFLYNKLFAEYRRRLPILKAHMASKWDVAWGEGPIIYVVLDEFAETNRLRAMTTEDGVFKMSEMTTRALQLFRAVGIVMILATQAPSAKAFGGDTDGRSQLPTRVSFSLRKGQRQFVFDNPDLKPEELKRSGEFLMEAEMFEDEHPMKAVFVSDEMVRSEVLALASLRGEPKRNQQPDLHDLNKEILKLLTLHGPMTRSELAAGLHMDSTDRRLDAARDKLQAIGMVVYDKSTRRWHAK